MDMIWVFTRLYKEKMVQTYKNWFKEVTLITFDVLFICTDRGIVLLRIFETIYTFNTIKTSRLKIKFTYKFIGEEVWKSIKLIATT